MQKANAASLRQARQQVLFQSMKGVLDARSDPDGLRQQAWWVLEALSAAMDGGFDPFLPLDIATDLPAGSLVGASLLALRECDFDARFMDAWQARFGQESIFPAQGPCPAAYWAQEVVGDLARNVEPGLPKKARVLSWVLDNAPADRIPVPLLEEIAHRLEGCRTALGMDPDLQALLDRIAPRLADDPRRPVARWLPERVLAAQEMDLDAPVIAASGRERPLRELMRLAMDLKPPAPETGLPELPHRRLKELARDYILAPDVSLDTARARLWACVIEKPEVVFQLLDWHADPPSTRVLPPESVDRIARVFRARDTHGRGLLAFLAVSRSLDAREMAVRILDTGLLAPGDVLSAQGHGIAEQALVGLRGAFRDDAFDRTAPKPWAIELFGRGAVLGPPDRLVAIAEDLIDAMLPGHHPHPLVKPLLDLVRLPSLEQAALWADLVITVRISATWLDQPRRQSAQESEATRLSALVDGIVEHARAHPGVLGIGRVEIRQWERVVFKDLLAKKNNVVAKALTSRMQDLERVATVADMTRHLPDPAPQRPRPRL